MTSHGFSLKRPPADAMFSGLIALIIFGPIAGVVLTVAALTLLTAPGPMVGYSDGWAFSLSAF